MRFLTQQKSKSYGRQFKLVLAILQVKYGQIFGFMCKTWVYYVKVEYDTQISSLLKISYLLNYLTSNLYNFLRLNYVYILADIPLCGRNLNSDVIDVFIINSVDLATWKSVKVNVKKLEWLNFFINNSKLHFKLYIQLIFNGLSFSLRIDATKVRY